MILPRGLIERDREELPAVLGRRGDPHLVAKHDRRRPRAPVQRRLPANVLGLAPRQRQARLGGLPGPVRSTELRPLPAQQRRRSARSGGDVKGTHTRDILCHAAAMQQRRAKFTRCLPPRLRTVARVRTPLQLQAIDLPGCRRRSPTDEGTHDARPPHFPPPRRINGALWTLSLSELMSRRAYGSPVIPVPTARSARSWTRQRACRCCSCRTALRYLSYSWTGDPLSSGTPCRTCTTAWPWSTNRAPPAV